MAGESSTSSSSISSGSGSSSSSGSSASGSPPRKASLRKATKPDKGTTSARPERNAGRSRSPAALKKRRVDSPRRERRTREDSPVRRHGGAPERSRGSRREDASPPRRRERDEEPRRRQNGSAGAMPPPPPPPRHAERGSRDERDGRSRGGRSRFDEAPAPGEEGGAHGGGAEGAAAGRHEDEGGARQEALPGPPPRPPPGPPGPPPRKEDREWNQRRGKGDGFPEDKAAKEDAPPIEPNYGLSGKLAEESNTVKGVVMLHAEPPEARKPGLRWRLYTFKNGEPFGDPLYIHRQSCYLFGRERRVADVPTDHPSCSKQHGVLQYRLTEKEGEDGMMSSAVRPYVMDLGSTNGTFLNNERLESQRYYELYEKDLIRFGNSSREYVLLHERSAGEA